MKTFVRLAVSAAILAVLFTRSDATRVMQALLGAEAAGVAFAFAIYLTGQAVSAIRWQRLARSVGFEAPTRSMLRFYLIGMFFGLAIPSTIGSDASRAVQLGRAKPGHALALSTVLFDRLIGLVVLVGLGALALLVGPSDVLPPSLVTGVSVFGGLLVVGWLAMPLLARLLPEGSRARVVIRRDLAPFFRSPSLLASVMGLSLGVHLLQIVAQKTLAGAIGLDIPWSFVFVYHPLVTLAAAVPFTVGGFGTREAAYATLLAYVAVAEDQAIALSLLWWAIGAVGGLLGGALYAAERPVVNEAD